MKMTCMACGVEKDTATEEIYPFPDDGIVVDRPVAPLFAIECQGPLLTSNADGTVTTSDWRVVVVCHRCLHRLSPDVWISDEIWAAIDPATPFAALPRPAGDESIRFKVESYA
jgi:hypothetical protein